MRVNEIFPIEECKKSILPLDKRANYTTAFYTAFDRFKLIIDNELTQKEQSLELQELIGASLEHDVILTEDKINPILDEYIKIACCAKEQMKQTLDQNIDEHKISSLMLLAIMRHSDIIRIKCEGLNITFKDKPYLYFALILATVIIEGMHKENYNEEIEFNLDLGYASHFVKMIEKNKDLIYVLPFLYIVH